MNRISVKCMDCGWRGSRVRREIGSPYGLCYKCGGLVDIPIDDIVSVPMQTKSYDINITARTIVRTHKDHIELFLGPLEVIVMDKFWDRYPDKMSCKNIQRKLELEGSRKSISTVSTTIKRLTRRGILRRIGPGGKRGGWHPHMFCAECTREEFIDMSIRNTLSAFRSSFPDIFCSIVKYYI